MGVAKLGGSGLESFMRLHVHYQLEFLFFEGLTGAGGSVSMMAHCHKAASRNPQFFTM